MGRQIHGAAEKNRDLSMGIPFQSHYTDEMVIIRTPSIFVGEFVRQHRNPSDLLMNF
jgi:hypothetical protein